MYKLSLVFIACASSAIVSAFDPITLGIGSSTYILSGTAAAITSIGVLAFAKALVPAFGRLGKRDTNSISELDMDPLYDAISAVDVADCCRPSSPGVGIAWSFLFTGCCTEFTS